MWYSKAFPTSSPKVIGFSGNSDLEDVLKKYNQEYMKKGHTLLQLQYDLLMMDKEINQVPDSNEQYNALDAKYNTLLKEKDLSATKISKFQDALKAYILHVKDYLNSYQNTDCSIYDQIFKSNKVIQLLMTDLSDISTILPECARYVTPRNYLKKQHDIKERYLCLIERSCKMPKIRAHISAKSGLFSPPTMRIKSETRLLDLKIFSLHK